MADTTIKTWDILFDPPIIIKGKYYSEIKFYKEIFSKSDMSKIVDMGYAKYITMMLDTGYDYSKFFKLIKDKKHE